MAYADYRLCDICDSKTFYDANLNYQEPDKEHNYEWWLYGLGDWKVICQDCAKTHEVTIKKKDENLL